MAPEYSSIVGSDGGISRSGKSIYDALHDSPDFFLTAGDLEAILRTGLLGLNLNYPLRTRSKVLKTKVCEILGYPVPASFKRSKPRFLSQDFDTYVQKSNNLQIWNEEITPTRRYVIIRLDDTSTVIGLRVVTAKTLATPTTTSTHTKKYQAKSRAPLIPSSLASQSHNYSLPKTINNLPDKTLVLKPNPAPSLSIYFNRKTTRLNPSL